MLLAQIAGYPGAGKTRLCATLKRLYGASLTVIDTDTILGNVEEGVNRISRESRVHVVAVGTFGLEPDLQPAGYPVFTSNFYWWLDVPLDLSMERALKRQIKACRNNFDKFLKLQRSKTSQEISAWLNEYMNMKYRGERWRGLKDYFMNYKNDEGQLLFEPRQETEILEALKCALGKSKL